MGNIAIDIRNYYNSNTEDGSLARKYVQGKSNESQLKIVKMFKGVKIRKQDRGNIIAFFRDLSDDIRYPAVLAIILDQPEKDRWRITNGLMKIKNLVSIWRTMFGPVLLGIIFPWITLKKLPLLKQALLTLLRLGMLSKICRKNLMKFSTLYHNNVIETITYYHNLFQ